MTYEKSPWTLEQVLADMQQDQTDYFLIEEQGKLLAFLAIQSLIERQKSLISQFYPVIKVGD